MRHQFAAKFWEATCKIQSFRWRTSNPQNTTITRLISIETHATLWDVIFCITVVTQHSSKVNSDWIKYGEIAVQIIRAMKSVSDERKQEIVWPFSAQRDKGWQWTQLIQAGVGVTSQGWTRAITLNDNVGTI